MTLGDDAKIISIRGWISIGIGAYGSKSVSKAKIPPFDDQDVIGTTILGNVESECVMGYRWPESTASEWAWRRLRQVIMMSFNLPDTWAFTTTCIRFLSKCICEFQRLE